MKSIIRTLTGAMLFILLLAGCLPETTPTPAVEGTALPGAPTAAQATPLPADNAAPASPTLPDPTPTAIPPSPTPEPLALRVNGAAVSLAEFQAAYSRFQAAQAAPWPVAEAAAVVEADLIDTLLLAQAAASQGFVVSAADLNARVANVEQQAGGAEALAAWLQANFYTPETFAADLERAIAAAWMRDQVIQSVPTSGPQVRARQILLYNQTEAERVVAQFNSGTSFDVLASIYEPYTLGELGWFPRGYLAESAIEEAVFALEPGQISPIVQTSLGYHVLLVMAVEPDRPFSPEVRLALQEKALQTWLAEQRQQSDIRIDLSETKEELR